MHTFKNFEMQHLQTSDLITFFHTCSWNLFTWTLLPYFPSDDWTFFEHLSLGNTFTCLKDFHIDSLIR